jgi:hypothetical protein
MAEDLCADHFALFLRCPNGVHRRGQNMDAFLPNPAATSPKHTDMCVCQPPAHGLSRLYSSPLSLTLA